MGRLYNRTLDCGCMYSSDGGGGLMPCHYGYGCGKKGCDEKNECNECLEQIKKCQKAHKKWHKSEDYKRYKQECIDKNQ